MDQRVEFNIPNVPCQSFVIACMNPTCHTHFVSSSTPFVMYSAFFGTVCFEESLEMANIVTDQEHPHQLTHDKVTMDLLCVSCSNKVGLKLITTNPGHYDERYLLFVNQLVILNGREGPQPLELSNTPQAHPQTPPVQPPPNVYNINTHYHFGNSHPQADPRANPQADPRANPRANPQADPRANPQADPPANPPANPRANPQADPPADPRAIPQPNPGGHINPPAN